MAPPHSITQKYHSFYRQDSTVFPPQYFALYYPQGKLTDIPVLPHKWVTRLTTESEINSAWLYWDSVQCSSYKTPILGNTNMVWSWKFGCLPFWTISIRKKNSMWIYQFDFSEFATFKIYSHSWLVVLVINANQLCVLLFLNIIILHIIWIINLHLELYFIWIDFYLK